MLVLFIFAHLTFAQFMFPGQLRGLIAKL